MYLQQRDTNKLKFVSGKQIPPWCKDYAPDCGPKTLHKTAIPSQVEADFHSKGVTRPINHITLRRHDQL